MGMYWYISLSKIQYRLPVVLVMALLVVHTASGESDKENDFEVQIQSIQDGANLNSLEPVEVAAPYSLEGLNKDGTMIRRRRETKEECDQHYKFWDAENRHCNSCLCPAGQQSTAEFCGYGIVRGEPGCEPCPDNTYHNGTDNSIHCHPCTTCDPDAKEVAKCNAKNDTQCKCKAGFGNIKGHCVSCRDHPNAEGCPPVTTPEIPPETSPETTPEPSQEIPKDESKKPDSRYIIEWKVGLIVFACSGVSIIIGILAGIPIYKIYISRTQSRGNQGTSGEGGEGGIDMKEQRNGHAVDDQGPRDDPDAQHPQTENRESVANGEANGLLEVNGGGVTN